MTPSRIVHPRRSRRAKMLGLVEDAARALAREVDGLSHDDVVEMVGERVGWGLWDEPTTPHDTNEAELAIRAYEDEGG